MRRTEHYMVCAKGLRDQFIYLVHQQLHNCKILMPSIVKLLPSVTIRPMVHSKKSPVGSLCLVITPVGLTVILADASIRVAVSVHPSCEITSLHSSALAATAFR